MTPRAGHRANLPPRSGAVFGAAPDGVWQAPGRVNLIGEHTDYNEGFVLPFAIDRTARVAVRLRPDSTIRLLSTFGNQGLTTADAGVPEPCHGARLDQVSAGGAVGAAAARTPRDGPGPAAGLGCAPGRRAVLLPRHRVRRHHRDERTRRRRVWASEDMVLATQRAENDFVGAPTGIMDQSASLRGAAGHAVFLDCRDQGVRARAVRRRAAPGWRLLVIDTKVSHSHAGGGYAARRASCELGAEVLGVASLRDVGPGGPGRGRRAAGRRRRSAGCATW